LAVPAALFVNCIRICCIVIYNYKTVHELIHGPNNIFHSPIIFPVAFVLLGGASLILERLVPRVKKQPPPLSRKKGSPGTLALLSGLTGLFALALVAYTLLMPRQIKPGIALEQLPVSINGWQSSPALPPDSVFIRSVPDESLARTYTDSLGNAVTLYLAYFNRQTPKNQVLRLCREWGRNPAGIYAFNNSAGNLFNKACYQMLQAQWCVCFAYIIDGAFFIDRTKVKKQLQLSSFIKRKNNCSFLMIRASAVAGDTDAYKTLDSFLQAAAPALKTFAAQL
jgi:hypothetical protein